MFAPFRSESHSARDDYALCDAGARAGYTRRRWTTLGLAWALVLSATTEAVAQTVDQNLWVTNGWVYAVAATETTTYIGGYFTRVGPRTGGAVPINAVSGALGATLP